MQTIEEYKAYTKQLESDVGKWHRAFDALTIERNKLVNKVLELEAQNKVYKQRIEEADLIDTARMKQINNYEHEINDLVRKISALENEQGEMQK